MSPIRKTKESIKESKGGQLEIDNIDTPLGAAAEELTKAVARAKTSQNEKQQAEDNLIQEMKKANIRTLKFKGDTIRYKPGHTTPDKLQFVPA